MFIKPEYGIEYENKQFLKAKLMGYGAAFIIGFEASLLFFIDVLNYLKRGSFEGIYTSIFFFLLGISISATALFIIRKRLPPKAIIFENNAIIIKDFRNEYLTIPINMIECYVLEIREKVFINYIYFKEKIHGKRRLAFGVDDKLRDMTLTFLRERNIPRKGVERIESL